MGKKRLKQRNLYQKQIKEQVYYCKNHQKMMKQSKILIILKMKYPIFYVYSFKRILFKLIRILNKFYLT